MVPIYVAEMAVQIQDRGRGVYLLGAIGGLGASLAYWV